MRHLQRAARRHAGRTARRTMMRVFWDKGLYMLAERLTRLIDSPRPAEWKRSRFQVILDKYAAAVV